MIAPTELFRHTETPLFQWKQGCSSEMLTFLVQGFFGNGDEQDIQQPHKKEGHGGHGHDDHGIHTVGFIRHIDPAFLGSVDLVRPDQESLGIDAVGGAGQQGAVVLPFLNSDQGDVVRLYDADLIHLVGQDLIEDGECKGIPGLHAVQMGKEQGRGQAAVGGNNAVGAGTSDGQAAALKMSGGDAEDRIRCTVVTGSSSLILGMDR